MARVGRNDLCPCGSGIKYKRCCLRQRQAQAAVSPLGQLKISLMAEIERIQAAARSGEETVRELGVFVMWASKGDAWLLEITESDAVQVASGGEPLPVPIDENPETIAINWSHIFAIRDKQLFLTAYADKEEICLEQAPTQRIHAALRRIRKRFSPEQLSQVHVSGEQVQAAG